MDFTKKDLDEFKRIIKEDYNYEMDAREAYRAATKIVNFFKIVTQPMPEDSRRDKLK